MIKIIPRQMERLHAAIRQGDIAHETIERARRLTDRLMPYRRPPHGFYDFAAFVDPARGDYAVIRRHLFTHLCKRIRAKIEARDS